MAARALLAAVVLSTLAGCGGGGAHRSEVRLLAPAGLVGDPAAFERRSGCRVDLRVYDEDENIAAIARRRDVDVVARPTRQGESPHDSVELVRIAIDRDLEIVVPKRFAGAYRRPMRPAGLRTTRWVVRSEGPNPGCARRWLAYATSQ
jgi:hypothetical protein